MGQLEAHRGTRPLSLHKKTVSHQVPKAHDLRHRDDKIDISEQKRLAKAVAMADDVPELVSELKKRTARIAHLDAQIQAAKRTPDDVAALVTKIEVRAR